MKVLKLFQKLAILLFVGLVFCAIQSCSSDDDKIDLSDTKKNVSLLKLWYLTDEYESKSGLSIILGDDSIVVDRKESMQFSLLNDTYILSWKNRLNKDDAVYYLSGFDGNAEIGTSFTIKNVKNNSGHSLGIRGIREKYLLIYDYSERLYKEFIDAEYAVFLDGGDDNGDDNGDDGSDDEYNDPNADNDGDGYPDKYKECPRCHGSGECGASNCNHGRCSRCGGSGYKYYQGVGGTTIKTSCLYCTGGKCEVCRGRNRCITCDGKGYVYK